MTRRGGDRGDRTMPQLAALPDNHASEGEAGFAQRAWKPPAETALARTRRLAQFMPLVETWRSPGSGRAALTAAERDLLAIVHLSVQQDASMLIRLPGGLHRLPMLAAAMITARLTRCA